MDKKAWLLISKGFDKTIAKRQTQFLSTYASKKKEFSEVEEIIRKGLSAGYSKIVIYEYLTNEGHIDMARSTFYRHCQRTAQNLKNKYIPHLHTETVEVKKVKEEITKAETERAIERVFEHSSVPDPSELI